MLRQIAAAALCWLVLTAGASASTGTVLVIANEDYATVADARGASVVLRSVAAFERMGFRVDLATDLSANAMRAALSSLADSLRGDAHERVVIVFAGRIVQAPHGVWLMGTDTPMPDFATVESHGVRLDTVLALAGARQGGAVVALADYGFVPGARSGFSGGLPAEIAVPQGVSLVRGAGPALAGFLGDLAQPGANVVALVAERPELRLDGFAPPYLTFLPEGHQPAIDADLTAWQAAEAAGTIEAYQDYLAQFPGGAHVALAQAALARLMNTPERIEAALNLSRDERRAIQRDLTLLGYDPRGIDGIFGGGTRAAIAAWQGANRFGATGYLNRDQVFELAQQGARRAAQLEAEARARAQEEERRDRAYWRDTGSGQDEAGLRAYLAQYPEGIFAAIARDRLASIEADRRAEAEAGDRAAWAEARAADSVAAYRQYLRLYPEGLFAEDARARLEVLMGPREPQIDRDAARREEEALALAPVTLMLIERRLARLGFDPGVPDGVLDRDARRAIRAYQEARSLPPTGFLTQALVVELTTGGLLDMLR